MSQANHTLDLQIKLTQRGLYLPCYMGKLLLCGSRGLWARLQL